MFEFVRKWLQGPLAAVVLAIIAIPLAVTFGNMDAGTAVGGAAAEVNGEAIGRRDFDRVFEDRRALRLQSGTAPLTPADELAVRQEVLDQLVLNRAVIQFVGDLGFRASDARVARAIREQPAFQVGGEFSKIAYEGALAARGVPATAFEEDQRSALSLDQLQGSLLDGAFITPLEYRRYLELELERRVASWVILDARTLAAALPVTDADIQMYYAANADQFRGEESVALDYVEVGVADLARDFVPDEAALRAAYDGAEPGRFRTGEERRARHILLATRPDRDAGATARLAAELVTRIAGGADFAALAREFSSDTGSAGKGGDLGFASRGAYVPEFEAALFALKPGEVSAPVTTQFGVHIIRLDEVKPGSERSFDEVRAELADELRQQKAQDEFLAAAERLDDLALENPTSLEPVAKGLNLPVRRVDPFTRKGGGAFGVGGALVEAVFADAVLTGGENTPMVELADGRAVVARVAEYRPAAARPLESVKGEVLERLRGLRAATEAKRRGESIRAQAEAGTPLATAAAGLPVVGPLAVTRRSGGTPPELLQAVFRAPRPQGQAGVVRGVELPGGYAVVRVEAVEPGNPAELPQALRDQRRRQLVQQAGIIEVEALAGAVKSAAKITVAKDLFEPTDDL